MARSERDEKILRETEETDEPIFIFRGKDILSVFPLMEYSRVVELYGPTEHEFAEEIVQRIDDFKAWQHANVGKVRYPD